MSIILLGLVFSLAIIILNLCKKKCVRNTKFYADNYKRHFFWCQYKNKYYKRSEADGAVCNSLACSEQLAYTPYS